MPMTQVTNHGQPIENVGEEISIVTQLDEERKWFCELPNTTSKKLGFDKKIMLKSFVTKWILRKETKLGCTLYAKFIQSTREEGKK